MLDVFPEAQAQPQVLNHQLQTAPCAPGISLFRAMI